MELADYPKVTVILRNAPRALADAVIGTIASDGLELAIEITRNSANFNDVARYVLEYPHVTIGAGTILTGDDASLAVDAGCKFILSPVALAPSVVDLGHTASMLVIPGAYTPTEIYQAFQEGADIVKLFPIRDLSAHYVRDVKATLGDIPIMGVGGVSMANMDQLLAGGVDYVGIGSGLFGREPGVLTDERVGEALRHLAAAAAATDTNGSADSSHGVSASRPDVRLG